MGKEESEAALEVLRSGILTDATYEGGRWVREFENKLGAMLKVRHVIAVSSGTAALYLSLKALGIEEGDEVIVPSFTFVATANAVLATGAKPVFVDVGRDHNIDPEEVRKKVTKRTRAIIPVDVYGYPADLAPLAEIAGSRQIPVVEDAAESIGAKYRGNYTGTRVTAGCFSLYATKVITSGEGGAISTNDPDIADRLRMVRNHGFVKGHDTRMLGFNLRLPELLAAVASVQMDRLDGFLASRRRNAEFLTAQTGGLSGVRMHQNAPDRTHSWYLFTVDLRRGRDLVLEKLRRAGVGASVYWPTPIHRTPLYESLGYAKVALPRTDSSSRTVLSLPVHPGVSAEELAFVARSFRKAVESTG